MKDLTVAHSSSQGIVVTVAKRAALLVCLCGVVLPVAARARQVTLAVTIPDIAPIVQAVGGDTVRYTTVMPTGADPHSFRLTVTVLLAARRS